MQEGRPGLLAAALQADWSTDQANTNPSAIFGIGPAIWGIPKVHLKAAPDDVLVVNVVVPGSVRKGRGGELGRRRSQIVGASPLARSR